MIPLKVAAAPVVLEAATAAVDFLDRIARERQGVAVDPIVDAEYGATDRGYEIEIVCDHEDGHLLSQFHESFDQLGFDGKVDVRSRFVENKQLGVAGQCAGDEDSLPFSAGKVGEGAMGKVGHLDFVECGHGPLAAFSGKAPEAQPIEAGHEDDVEGSNGKLGVKVHRLGHVSQRLLGAAGAFPEDLETASTRLEEPEDEFYEGRLPPAVGSDHAEGFPPANREGNVLQNESSVVPKRKMPTIDDDLCLVPASFGGGRGGLNRMQRRGRRAGRAPGCGGCGRSGGGSRGHPFRADRGSARCHR